MSESEDSNTKAAVCTHCGARNEIERTRSTFECDECGEKTVILSDPR
ncbi:MAG: hypothetical protein ACOCTH_02765 [Halodesulfurarchaeum sp.]